VKEVRLREAVVIFLELERVGSRDNVHRPCIPP
jgi:hypothetical protein